MYKDTVATMNTNSLVVMVMKILGVSMVTTNVFYVVEQSMTEHESLRFEIQFGAVEPAEWPMVPHRFHMRAACSVVVCTIVISPCKL